MKPVLRSELWVLSAEFSPFGLRPRILARRVFPDSLASPAHPTFRALLTFLARRALGSSAVSQIVCRVVALG